MWSDKGKRSWLASFVFLTLVVGLIFFLTFLEVPDKNKDLITSIIGMIVGSISTVISIFVGRDPDDVKELRETITELNSDRNALIERLRDAQLDKDTLRKQLESLQGQVIDRLSIFVGEHRLAEVGGATKKLSPEVERWMPKPHETPLPDSISPLPKNKRHRLHGPPTPLAGNGLPVPPSTQPPQPAAPEPEADGDKRVAEEFDAWLKDFGDEDK